MRTARIYKDNIREHVLRSLLFTDNVIFIAFGACIAGILYVILQFGLHMFQWGLYISSVIVAEILFVGVATQRIDNQPIYQLIPRLFTFGTSKKKYRQKQITSYLTDFSISENFIIRQNNLIAVYNIEPFDIALLNDQDREVFFQHLKLALHVLPGRVQLIVRKETAKVSDYSKHFFSIYDQSDKKREPLINTYIEDLSSLVQTKKFLIVKYYAVFSVAFNPTKPQERVESTQKLHDMGVRFAGALHNCNVTTRQLTKEELVEFCRSQLR